MASRVIRKRRHREDFVDWKEANRFQLANAAERRREAKKLKVSRGRA